MDVIPVSTTATKRRLPAVEPWIHFMAVCLAYPSMTVVVASVPLPGNNSLTWSAASSRVRTRHWPSSAPPEPDGDAEHGEGQRSERKYGERPGDSCPSLQRGGEKREAINEGVGKL